MRQSRRPVLAALGAAAWWLLSCSDIPAPQGGIAALSPLQFPLPGVVLGDTMRDSLGLVAPLRVIAYGVDGEPLSPQPTASFVVIDTGAHFAGALLIGDSLGPVRIVGTVGVLQTRPASVKITLSPDTLVPADSIVHHKTYSIISGDSVAQSADLAVLVQHLGTPNTGVEAVIVHYTIDQQPQGNGNGPTVVLVSGNAISTRDTTETSGRAARVARLRLLAMNATSTSDTVLVSATASYRGQVLGVVPFAVIYTRP